jgi:outer membrane protein insertion porin family
MLTRLPGVFHKGQLALDTLEEDMRAIRSLYMARGFLNILATYQIDFDPNRESARIHVTLEEGDQVLVGDIGISGLLSVSLEQARSVMKLRPGEPFRPYMVESDRNALSELISETGRPRVQIRESVNNTPKENRADIHYDVEEGPEVVTGRVRFAGNFRTRESVLENEITLKSGEPFRLAQLLKDQARLRDLGIFDSVRFELFGLSEGEPVVDVLITVEERKPYRIETGVGYETEKGTFFHTKLADINFMGADIDAWIAGEISEIGYEFSSDITDPTLLDTRFSGSLGVYAEEVSEFNQAYGTRSVGVTASIRRKFNPVWETGLIFLLENRSVFSADGEPLVGVSDEFGQPLEESKRSFYSAAPYIQYDSRDSRIRPKSGGYANISVEPVRGIDSDLDHFMRYKGDFRYLISPFSRLTLATMLKSGYIRPMNDSGMVSTDQLLYLGGASTVRGYDENLFRYSELGDPVGGRFSLCGSLENRIDLTGNLELALFVDAGKLGEFQVDGISDDVRFSVGIGLRYITPVGPMGIMYGHKLDREPGESSGRFHIAIGYTF